MNETETNRYLNFAMTLARRAGDIQLRMREEMFRNRASETRWLEDGKQFTSRVDEQIGKMVRQEIADSFPNHSVISEEIPPAYLTDTDFTWVVDELDGTGPYLRKTTDHHSFCIALCLKKTPVLGVINAPSRGEVFSAVQGKGAYRNGIPIYAGNVTEISKVWMGMDPGKFNRDAYVPYIQKGMQAEGISCFLQSGCASVPLCLVASGQIEAYLATSLNPEDMAAAVVICREAGCKVTNLVDGQDWKLGDSSILAANPVLHQKLWTLFKG